MRSLTIGFYICLAPAFGYSQAPFTADVESVVETVDRQQLEHAVGATVRSVLASEPLKPIDVHAQLAPLMIERHKHAAQYGENHPIVKRFDAQLAVLKAELRKLVEEQTEAIRELRDPTKLTGFLKPGTKVALYDSPDKSEFIRITILPDDYFMIAKDSLKLDLADLAKKYETVAIAVDRAEKRVEKRVIELTETMPDHMELSEPRFRFRKPSGTLGTIASAGDDYLIVSFQGKRRLFPTRLIRTIEWHEGEPDVWGSIGQRRKKGR